VINAKERERKMTVKTEINGILEKLQDKIPCNPNAKQNVKLADRMEKDLVDYFNAMNKAFPYQDLERIYSKYEEKI
jgi:hypothetical protein